MKVRVNQNLGKLPYKGYVPRPKITIYCSDCDDKGIASQRRTTCMWCGGKNIKITN